MRLLVAGFGISALLGAANAQAGPVAIPSPLVEAQPVSTGVNLRLVADRLSDPARILNSGMVAQKTIAPNAVLGIGLFKMTPKKLGSNDVRIDGPAPKSRKAAVSFVFKF